VNQKPASEQSHKSAEEKDVSHVKMRVAWEQKKLELLRLAEEKVQEGVRRVKRALSGSRGKY